MTSLSELLKSEHCEQVIHLQIMFYICFEENVLVDMFETFYNFHAVGTKL